MNSWGAWLRVTTLLASALRRAGCRGWARHASIMPAHAPGFVLAQLAGAAAATLVFRWLLREG